MKYIHNQNASEPMHCITILQYRQGNFQELFNVQYTTIKAEPLTEALIMASIDITHCFNTESQ